MTEPIKSRPDHVLEDPGTRAVATLYAQSYLSGAENASDAVEELASFVDDVLSSTPELRSLIHADVLNKDQLVQIIDASIAPHSTEYFANFLRVLVKHGRLSAIEEIRMVADEIRDELAGRQKVKVRSARPLSDSSRTRISEQLRAKLGFEPILMESVDESLIGGLVIQVGDIVYDSSLRSRLSSMSDRLTERTFNEIQSGRDRFSHPEGD